MKASRYLCQFICVVVLGTLVAVFTSSWWMTAVAAVAGVFLGGCTWDELAKNLVIRSRVKEYRE